MELEIENGQQKVVYSPDVLRTKDVKIEIAYRDIFDRQFKTVLEGGRTSFSNPK